MHEEHRERHIIGPILLILAGIGLLLEQFGMLSIQWGSLWQYWPVLLILLGLDILLGRTRLGSLLVLVVTVAAVAVILVGMPIPWIEPRGQVDTKTYAFPLDHIEEAEIRLSPGIGRVTIDSLGSKSDAFANIVIEQNIKGARYGADLTRSGKSAELRIKSDKATWSPSSDGKGDRWTIQLHPEPLLSLQLDGGVGVSEYDLTGLNLARMDLNVGIGDVDVYLPERGVYSVDVDGGIGRVTVHVPEHLPVQIDVDGGIGKTDVAGGFRKMGNLWVTDAWDKDQDAIEIDINGGIGMVSVR